MERRCLPAKQINHDLMKGIIFLQQTNKKGTQVVVLASLIANEQIAKTQETSSPPKWVQSADLLGRDSLKNENAALNSKFKYANTLQVTSKWHAYLKRAYSLIKVQLWSVSMWEGGTVQAADCKGRWWREFLGKVLTSIEQIKKRGSKMKRRNTANTPKP